MKYGMVAQLRINPEDCQSILDLMGLLNIDPYDGRSFAQCASLALSSMLGAYRKSGTLPPVDSFQYLNRLGPFQDARNNKRKKVMADALYAVGGGALQHAPVVPSRVVPSPGQYVPAHLQQAPRAGDIIPIQEEFDREAGMEEYNRLKRSIMEGNEDPRTMDRFIELQNKLY